MESGEGTLFIKCLGAHCDSFIKAGRNNLSTCDDDGKTYFGIYGLCEKPGCNFENLVREDHFVSSDLLIQCAGCAVKTPVKKFNWEKSGSHKLSFETLCSTCNGRVAVRWEVGNNRH